MSLATECEASCVYTSIRAETGQQIAGFPLQAALYNDRDGGDDPDAPFSAVERIEKFKEAGADSVQPEFVDVSIVASIFFSVIPI